MKESQAKTNIGSEKCYNKANNRKQGGNAMNVKVCEGVELEKTSKTSPEDSFNRSVITFETDERERTFHLLYLRFFEKEMSDFTPFDEDPIFTIGNRDVRLKDVAALVTVIQNPDYQLRKRLYLNDKAKFTSLFQDIDFGEVKKIFESLEARGSYELKSSIPFLIQPQKS